MGEKGSEQIKQKQIKGGGRVNHVNLLNCVNNLPPITDIYTELTASSIVGNLTYVNFNSDADAVNLGGAKRGLRSDLKKMTVREFHEVHGHLGACRRGEIV